MPRNNSVCQRCQERHLKCVREGDSEPCRRCKRQNLVCAQNSPLRVRNVLSVSRGERRRLDYDDDQVWVPVPASLSFAVPDEQRRTTSENEPSESHVETPQHSQSQYSSPVTTQSVLGNQYQDERHPATQPQQGGLLTSPYTSRNASNNLYQYTAQQNDETRSSSSGLQGVNLSQDNSTQALVFGNTSNPATPLPVSSPIHQIISSPYQSAITPWPFGSSHEARLFLHYVNRLSCWLDGLDSNRTFGTEVPRRAAHIPVLMNAILASAARHISFISGTKDTISEKYHHECLQILIPVLDNPCDVLDENLCAAIIILRQYEEYDEADERCHLFGSTRMVNSITPNTTPSSLRDSANWIALRQEIHISLTNKQPFSIVLDAYRQSPKLCSESEDGWANRIVLLFAKVLNYAFQSGETVPQDTWLSLRDEVETWNTTKPAYFMPLWDGSTLEQQKTPFPEVIMLSTAQANGMQHYCLSKILLAVYDPRLLKLGFDARKLRKESEEIVLQNLRMVVGLASSNPDIEILFMHASHVLSVCGEYFTDAYEQDAIVKFLRDIEAKGVWRTSSIIATLREQWK
ncbi:hypothetical protein BKA64DRAFT_263637 [Cadophora sp. MPI-SDFR-AT-0126]|nr:hypothetical protein BKA64DRAFT_263637 [Leotiomycetes sp. MPI-SDFR-AT-0126]